MSSETTLIFVYFATISLSLQLQSAESVSVRDTGWLGDIAGGLQAILTSRLDPARRNRALHLAAILTHLLGVSWAAEMNVKFFMILVNLVAVVRRKEVLFLCE